MEEKAIFKFNNGVGALLCSGCSAIIMTGLEMSENELAVVHELEPQYCPTCLEENKTSYTLKRENDSKIMVGETVRFVEWKDDGTFKKLHKKPKIGYSCILDAYYAPSYTWLTTVIIEITEEKENLIAFKTLNSSYILTW